MPLKDMRIRVNEKIDAEANLEARIGQWCDKGAAGCIEHERPPKRHSYTREDIQVKAQQFIDELDAQVETQCTVSVGSKTCSGVNIEFENSQIVGDDTQYDIGRIKPNKILFETSEILKFKRASCLSMN